MLKVFAFLTKLPHLSNDAFFAHWRHPHGTLTKRIPQFRRYAQNHGLGSPPALSGLPAPSILGIASVWVDDLDSLGAASAHPDYAPLDADGDEMYVRSALAWLVGQEEAIARVSDDAALKPVKAMLLLKTAAPDVLAVSARRAMALLPGTIGVSVTRPLDPAGAPYDGVIELFFADEAAARMTWTQGGPGFLKVLGDGADLKQSRGFFGREERVIWPQGAR